jgi:hypothetical protein
MQYVHASGIQCQRIGTCNTDLGYVPVWTVFRSYNLACIAVWYKTHTFGKHAVSEMKSSKPLPHMNT